MRFFLLLLFYFPVFLNCDITRAFEYNKNNQLTKEVRSDGRFLTYAYDVHGHVIQEISSERNSVDYIYDLKGNCTQMIDIHGVTIYKYDNTNRLILVQFPDSNIIQYKYSINGLLNEMIYPNGWKTFYRYDDSNRLFSVEDNSGETKYEYDNNSNTLTKIIFANGVATEYKYDRAKRIIDVLHARSDGSIIVGYHYSFDANGNRTEIVERSSTGTRKTVYSYDRLNRLISAEYPESYEKYTYDAAGNRLSKETPEGIIQYHYNKSNQLVKAGDAEFFYDLSGNLIQKTRLGEVSNYSYDVHDNLVGFHNASHSITYQYDGAGRRVAKILNGVKTNYINNVLTSTPQVILKTTNSNKAIALYTYGLSRIAQILPTQTNVFLHDYPDRSVVALVDAAENIINQHQYDSFGCEQRHLLKLSNEFLYAGEAYEEETGLIYLRNRYYDPEIGRFISADPEFGSVTNPQSLNPYVYVNNNPLNYIDPTGQRSAKACAYLPGTRTGESKSITGHGFWELTFDNGKVVTIGRYPRGIKDTDTICPGTASYEWPADDTQIRQIIENVSKGTYVGVTGNCINGLERGLEVLGVEHESFKEFGVSCPVKAVMWLDSLNGRSDYRDSYHDSLALINDPENYHPYAKSKPQIPVAARTTGDVGGVSLNKTAELLGRIADVEGATYDPSSGQLIMVGKKKKIKLPEMDFDDLAVAVRSIYGLGGKPPQDPGISFEMDPSNVIKKEKIIKGKKKPAPYTIRYDGETKNTRFGYIMYEADRLMKNLSLGKDNITGKQVKANVYGFKNSIDLFLENPYGAGNSINRYWFVPKNMSIHKTRKGKDIAFKKTTMKVMTESTFNNKVFKHDDSEYFAKFFTDNYEELSKEYPVLKELKRLAKITALVKWIRENDIPLDLSLFANYKPKHKDTPTTTPAITVSHLFEINNFTNTLSILGGVTYHFDESNFQEITTEKVDPLSEAALKARPSENVFKWTFKSPIDSQNYEAVAQTIERTAKVGNIRKACLDMQLYTLSDSPLELIRYYNSFNDDDIGFGRGWDIACTKLRFPRAKIMKSFTNVPNLLAVYPELYLLENDHEVKYKFFALTAAREPIYKSGDADSILIETESGFTLDKSGATTLVFSKEGKILSRSHNGMPLQAYVYKDNRLTEIVNKYGKKILLTYDRDRIVKAVGPGGKWVKYNYDSQKQVSEIYDVIGSVENYRYDKEKNLSQILNGKREQIFSAAYDDYHRATVESTFGKEQIKTFDLNAHTLKSTQSGQIEFSKAYDANYRLLQVLDSQGRSVKIDYYDGGSKPAIITDCLGNQKKYTYDSYGNISSITDSLGAVQKFRYNSSRQLLAYADTMGNGEIYTYNNLGQLVKACHNVKFIAQDGCIGLHQFTTNKDDITEFTYDSSGLLSQIFQSGRLIRANEYNTEGLLTSSTDAHGYGLFQSYDERGRLSKTWDTAGEGFTYTYDERDRLTSLSSPNGIVEYSYDAVDNLHSIKDALGNTVQYTYDKLNNLTKIEDPLGGITIYEYDQNRNLKQVVLPNKSIRKIEYDALNRPISEQWQ